MAGFEVAGRRFRTEADYRAALRDQAKINRIRAQVNMEQPGEVITLYSDMQSGKYRFETAVGNDFDDEIYELAQEFKRQGYNRDSRLTIEKEKKGRFSGWKAGRSADKSGEAARKDGKTVRLRERTNSSNRKPVQEELDEEMRKEVFREFKKREQRRRLTVLLCSFVAIACFGYFGVYYYFADRTETDYKNLAQLKGSGTKTGTLFHQIHYTEEEDVELEVLEEYQTLYNKNKKLIGWLKIDDTNIDYPVMQTTDNEYYLDHNMNQEYDKNGTIFMDKDCDVLRPSTNYILYGHHMKSGQMFGQLDLYKKKSYYEEHPYINFDTIYEKGTYQVMYVFRSKVYKETEIVFKYYQFIDANSEQEFDSYMKEMAELSLYDTGVTAEYGDQLLTLSTCDYQETDGRFVVVAKKIAKE